MKKFVQKFSVLILVLILAAAVARAIDNDEETIRKDLVRLLGSTNQGKEFFMTFHPCWESAGKNNAVKIYITSAVATLVNIEIEGKGVYLQQTTIPNDVIEFSFDPSIAQCYRKTDREPPLPQNVFKGFGIRVTANDPIVCYGVTRYQYTSDGYLAIPKSALGKKYVVASYNDPCKKNDSDGQNYQFCPSYTSIVAAYPKTEVKVRLGGRFSNFTPGKNSMHTGDTRTEIMNRGDVWLIGVQGDYNDLTGTTVEANKPVAVISGNFCAYIPIQRSACDYIIEQDLPMETWGNRYHVTKIIKRKNASIIRMFTSEPNTTIYRDGNEWTYVKGVGGAEGTGYIEMRAVGSDSKLRPVTISAKNRISVTQYNCGLSDDQVESDPFQMVLTPIEQYQTGFMWCTPGFNGGAMFKENYLNICYRATEDGQMPNDMEFGKVTNGVIYWQKLSNVLGGLGEPFMDQTDSCQYYSATITLPDPTAVYALRSVYPLAAYGYGFDLWDSYGFPVSLALADLTKPDIWAPKMTYTMDCLGNVAGNVTEQPEFDESLRSNLGDINLRRNESYNFSLLKYDEDNFMPGTTYYLDWSLEVDDLEHDAMAVIDVYDRAGNDTTISIEYKRTLFNLKNKIENWGTITFNGAPEVRELTLINDSEKPVVVDSIILLSSVKGGNQGYNGFKLDSSIYKKYGGILPGYTMERGEQLKFKVSFDAQSVRDDILSGKNRFLDSVGVKAYWSDEIHDYCYYKYRALLKASTGTPCIKISRLDFGKLTVNNSLTKTVGIFNLGSAELTITGYNTPDGVYVTELGDISPSNPLIIPPGDGHQFKVTFTPSAVKQYPEQIVFISDADSTCSGYDPILELTGEGIQPGIELIGYDWARMRVHLPIYDQPSNPYGTSTFPYSTKSGDTFASMKMSNTGSEEFTITEVYVKDTVNSAYFLVDFDNDGKIDGTLEENLSKLIKKKILPTEEYIYPVYYDPRNIGEHRVTVIIKTEKDGFQLEGECTFRGTGVYPKGFTSDYMFTKDEPNQTAMVDTTHPGYDVNIKFTAENWGEFADSLTIYDVKLVLAEAKGISTDIKIPGDRLFAFDKDSLKFPIRIKAGDTLSFPAKYYPKKSSPNAGNNPFIAHIIFVTDADVSNHTSEWTGKSISQGASADGTTISACLGYEEIGTVKITNTADAEIQVTDMYIRPLGGDANALSIVDEKPFKLVAGESKEVQVLFKQDTPGITDANLVFVTSIKSTPEITASINCNSITYPRKSSGKISGAVYSAAEPFRIGLSKKKDDVKNTFNYAVCLDSTSEDMAKVTKETHFYVEVLYNRNFMGAEYDNAKKLVKLDLGKGLNPADYVIEDVKELKIDDKYSKITATLRNISGIPLITKSEIELLKLNFRVFLPENPINGEQNESVIIKIEQNVTTNEACVPISPNTNNAQGDAYLEIVKVCVQDIRSIEVHESAFGIREISPNPVGSQGADVYYYLGFDCTAEMTIYNSAGSVVAKPVNMKQPAGSHTVAVPISELASGIYIIELKAGPYVGTKRLVIQK